MKMLSAVLAVLVLAGPLAAQKGGAEPDTVKLRFGWEAGWSGTVAYEQVRTRDGVDAMRVGSETAFRVEAHPEGLRVRWGRDHWTELPAEDTPMGVLYQALRATEGAPKPSWVVSPDGGLLRLEGMEAMAEGVRAAFQPMLAADSSGVVAQLMATLLSDETLLAQARENWETTVSFWMDADLVLGGTYEMDTSVPSPLAPGIDLESTLEFGPTHRMQCPGRAAQCVELAINTYPDPEGLRAVVLSMMSSAAAELDANELASILEGMELSIHNLIVVEEGTLRPISRVQEKVVRVEVNGVQLLDQVDTATWHYRWN